MNERIKELANKAGLSYLYDYDADGHAMVCSEKDIKKFAELLVQECVEVCHGQATYDPQTLPYKPSKQFADAIKEHFGVEQ